jgi:hypothetical protein
MDNQTLFKYMEELRQQSRFALLAFQNLKGSLNAIDSERIFLFVYAFLNHALAVSRLLWPIRAESQDRGRQLREQLKVEDSSPLALREISQQLEKVDERYEDWLTGLENRNYVDMNVMPATAIGEFKQDAFQRSLDPDTFRLQLRGAVCDLRLVADSLRKLESNLQYWLRSHHPW